MPCPTVHHREPSNIQHQARAQSWQQLLNRGEKLLERSQRCRQREQRWLQREWQLLRDKHFDCFPVGPQHRQFYQGRLRELFTVDQALLQPG